jgi:alkanesulfonate monooxygenase SsuD/methylene tetrahydromethanopterin reductase-like flavin-dependent oxidoreductase (luciferase family)
VTSTEVVERHRAAGREFVTSGIQSWFELLERVCAVGSPDEVIARISAYHDAGADVVGVAPSTAEDPGGRGVLTALSTGFQRGKPQIKELAS